MFKITKSIIIFSLIVFALTTGANILAEENTNSDATAATINEQITSQDLDVSDPKLLPGNPLYFLKEWGRGIQSLFAFGNLKKAELYQKFASERLAELKKLADEGKVSSDILKKATDKYEKAMEKIKERADKIKERASDSEEVNKFLEKFTNQQVLHEKILEKLEGQVPEQALEKIKEAREQHLERFKDVMTKLENNKDRLAERVKNALQNGDTTNPEILDRIKDKMPDDVKEKINAVRTKVMDKVIEKIKRKNPSGANCPTLAVSADFCKQGKITAERDDEGCIIKLNCVELTNEATCKTDIDCPSIACTTRACDNVCTKRKCLDGKCVLDGLTPIKDPCPTENTNGKSAIVGRCVNQKCHVNGAACEFDYQCPRRPTTKEECLQRNGTWGTIGLSLTPQCNLKTTDSGKTCTDSSQCQGMCIGENQQSTTGGCSEWLINVGCLAILENGKVNGILCAD